MIRIGNRVKRIGFECRSTWASDAGSSSTGRGCGGVLVGVGLLDDDGPLDGGGVE